MERIENMCVSDQEELGWVPTAIWNRLRPTKQDGVSCFDTIGRQEKEDTPRCNERIMRSNAGKVQVDDVMMDPNSVYGEAKSVSLIHE